MFFGLFGNILIIFTGSDYLSEVIVILFPDPLRYFFLDENLLKEFPKEHFLHEDIIKFIVLFEIKAYLY